MSAFAILSNRVITPGGMKKSAVLIQHGRIADIVNELPEGDIPVVDVGNDVVMPGIIDPHVHINEPGRTDWEGFDTATKAAIAGGITTLVDMPLNSSPVTTTVKAFEEKLKAAGDDLTVPVRSSHSSDLSDLTVPVRSSHSSGRIGQTETVRPMLHSNCGFWGGVIPGNENEIEPLIERGVLGFKAFLTHSGIDEFPNVTENDLRKVMPIIARYGLPLLVHCELTGGSPQPIVDSPHPIAIGSTAGSRHPIAIGSTAGNDSYGRYVLSRPKKWEDDAIALMIRLCEEFNCRTHIVHLSSADSIGQIVKAKQKRLPLTVETGQHYLYFTAEEIKDGQTAFKCAPPIREKANNEKLWQALKDNIIDFVATDHSPAPPGMKELASGDFMKAWGGISSIQFALPVLWTAAKKHGCDITAIARWLCEKPAALPGLKTKGIIAKGYDADLVVWNPEKNFTVGENMIHHRHKITPYTGEQLYGVVQQTYLGGLKVFDNGEFVLNKGSIIIR